MKFLTLISIVLFSSLLLSCSHDKTEDLPAKLTKQVWTCNTGVIIEWQAENSTASKIQLRLDDSQKLYILDKVYATNAGTLYSNGELAFRIKNQSGVIFWAFNDEIIGENCNAH